MAQTPILHLPFPTEDDTVDPPRDFAALANAIDPLGVVPIGVMMMWLTGVSPAGWLLMQGQLVDAATYPVLAQLLGQDANGKVTIPDMRDRFPVCAGATMPLGAIGGAAAVALDNVNQLPAHNHGVNDPTHTHTTDAQGSHSHGGATTSMNRSNPHGHTIHSNYSIYNASGGSQVNWTQAGSLQAMYRTNMVADAVDINHEHGIYADGSHAHNVNAKATGITIQNAGGGQTHENRPPFRAINFIIRAG